jgi:hypothetical protein
MDLLFKRYASPFPFLDGMILSGSFCDFVEDFVDAINRETEEKNAENQWKVNFDVWLHRVFDKSFRDFMDGIENDKQNQEMSEKALETTYHHSMDILKNFNPEQNGGET